MRTPNERSAAVLLSLALAVALSLASTRAAATDDPVEVASSVRQRQPDLTPAPPPDRSLLVATHALWQQEWRLLEARLLALSTLPAELAIQSHAALREELARRGTPTRFAPDWPRERRLWVRSLSRTGGPDASPVGRAAVMGGEAWSTASAWAGMHFWAEGAGYAVGRRSAGYGIEGGAALPLDDGIDLTAGVRLAGYALGTRLDPELTDVEDRVVTPFVGLDFEF